MIGIQKSKALLKNKSIKISWLSRGMSFRENGIYLPFIHKIFKPKEVATSNSVMGSNMAFFKEDFIKVNGYDNSLQGWGAEDKELAQRFVNAGLKRRKMKFLGIQYHLYHKEEDKSNQPSHLNFTSQIEKSKTITCKNGLLHAVDRKSVV